MATQTITVNSANYLFNVASIASGDTVKFVGGKKKNVPSLLLEFLAALRTDSSDVAVDTAFQKIKGGVYNDNKTIVLTFAGNRTVKIKKGLWGFATKIGGSEFYSEPAWDAYVAANPIGNSINYTLTSSPDTATAKNFFAPKAYTPGGTDLVNTLQNEDVLTGDTSTPGATKLTGDLGNPNDSGDNTIAPSITNVDEINIAFTSTSTGMTLDFQDIAGTETANITRISAALRQTFNNLDADVATLGIANTNEEARATIQYLNNELDSATNAVTLNLNNVRLSGNLLDLVDGGALNIGATAALGGDLQNQIETFNINVLTASTVATFSTAFNGNDYDDLVVGERPQTLNIDADAALAIGTLRWLGNRVETNTANQFQVAGLHQVGLNGEGFVEHQQIVAINLTGAGNVTLANVGDFTSTAFPDTSFSLNASGLTGRLTADISNGVDTLTPGAFIYGGSAADRFYVDGTNWNVRTVLQGNAGIDSLTYQSGAASNVVAPGATSSSIEWLNIVNDQNSGATDFVVNMTDGGEVAGVTAVGANTVFDNVTINNMLAAGGAALTANIRNLSLDGELISIRSQLQDGNGNPNLLAAAANVDLNTTSAAGGTVNLQLGSTTDDRSTNNAFSVINRTNTVNLDDTGNSALNLNVELNSAAAGAINLNLQNEFVAGNGLTGTTTITGVATNALNVGLVGSQAYNGSAYGGTQDVEFGTAAQTAQGSNGDEIGLNIQTGAQNDIINLQRITTSNVAPPATTPGSFAASAFLRNTSIAGGAGVDKVILSANLVDPRVVLVADATYDAYFTNWSGVEELTFNNFNSVGAVVVGLATQAQEAGLGSGPNANWLTFEDVSATVNVGFEFTRNVEVFADQATAVAANRAITLNMLSAADLDVVIDASRTGLAGFRTDLLFVSTGANPSNNVTATYNDINTNANGGFYVADLAVPPFSIVNVQNGGSVDLFDFNGIVENVTPGFDFFVVTGDTWTAAGQATTYDVTGTFNTTAVTSQLFIDAAAETNGTVTFLGASTNISNTFFGGQLGDTITSFGRNDFLVGNAGADVITYDGVNQLGVTNNLQVDAGAGDDSVTLANMVFLGDLDTSTVVLGEGNDSFVGSAGNDTVTGGRNANNITLTSGGVDTVRMTTVLNTADTVIGWTAGAIATVSDVLEIDLSDVNAEVAGDLRNSGGAVIAAGPAALTSLITTAGTDFTILATPGNIFRMDTNNIAGVNTLLFGSNTGLGAASFESLTFAFIDNNSDLQVGVASYTTDAAGLITSSSANVTQVFQGTYTLAGLDNGNFNYAA